MLKTANKRIVQAYGQCTSATGEAKGCEALYYFSSRFWDKHKASHYNGKAFSNKIMKAQEKTFSTKCSGFVAGKDKSLKSEEITGVCDIFKSMLIALRNMAWKATFACVRNASKKK